ncbi:hypothetical protein AMTRI_Chr05g61830 [Amborella trichopoda]
MSGIPGGSWVGSREIYIQTLLEDSIIKHDHFCPKLWVAPPVVIFFLSYLVRQYKYQTDRRTIFLKIKRVVRCLKYRTALQGIEAKPKRLVLDRGRSQARKRG